MTRVGYAVVCAVVAVLCVAGCASPVVSLALSAPTSTEGPRPLTCPASSPGEFPRPGAPSPLPAAPASILVPGTPNSMTLCRYLSMNSKPALSLARFVTASGAALTRLVAALNATPLVPPGARSCPVDFGLRDLILFHYPDGHQIDVLVALSGCGGASNGHRTVDLSEDISRQIGALVGESSRP